MISSIVLVAITGTFVAAQSSTVISLMLPAVDPQALVASVIDASPAITTYAVQCADDTKDGPECGLPHAQTIAQGPSTWSMHYSYSDEEYGSYEQDMWCDINRREDNIRCEVSMVEEYDGTVGTRTTTVSTEGIRSLFIPVTITGGLDKLDLSPGTTSDVSAASETGDAASERPTALVRPSQTTTEEDAEPTAEGDDEKSTESQESQGTNSEVNSSTWTSTWTSAPTPAPTPATTTNSDNAAFPKATQNAVLIGAAAFVGGIMML